MSPLSRNILQAVELIFTTSIVFCLLEQFQAQDTHASSPLKVCLEGVIQTWKSAETSIKGTLIGYVREIRWPDEG